MKNRVVLILPYFGIFPIYFNLWIRTAAANRRVDYLIITDHKFYVKMPENIYVKSMTFEAVRKLVQKQFEFRIRLKSPYKLCDYKPAYGIIFAEYIQGYEFWGHCDPDIIWGDIRNFVTDDVLDVYDRIYERGHLCIYRNDPYINRLFQNKVQGIGITYKDVYQTDYSCHFDEGEIIANIFKDFGKKVYKNIDCADVLCDRYEFTLFKDEYERRRYIFKYSDGRLRGYYLEKEQIREREFCYLHLQKRKMKLNPIESDFCIVPNEFLFFEGKLSKEYIRLHTKSDKKYEADYKKMIYKMKAENVLNGALLYRIKDKLNKK